MKLKTRPVLASMTLSIALIFCGSNALASDMNEAGSNNTIGSAQNIDGHFSLGENADIQDSTILPWVSISGSGDGNNDYYSFHVQAAGDTAVFDIDYGTGSSGGVDTELCLYAADGTVLASNDDSGNGYGAGGSASSLDSYITYTFPAAGTYVIAVGEYNVFCSPGGMTGNLLDTGDTYVLQVSLSQPAIADADSDGIADSEDCNPYSDLNPTVVFEGCDSGVTNTLFASGCSIADLIHSCADDTINHGGFASCVSAVTGQLKKAGDITGLGKGMIQSCAAQSDTGK